MVCYTEPACYECNSLLHTCCPIKMGSFRWADPFTPDVNHQHGGLNAVVGNDAKVKLCCAVHCSSSW